jgi:hypothetical protein
LTVLPEQPRCMCEVHGAVHDVLSVSHVHQQLVVYNMTIVIQRLCFLYTTVT